MGKRENITGILFIAMLCIGMVGSILLKDKSISYDERRYLAKLPEYSTKKLLDGSYMAQMDTYVLDHFIGREFFRTVKAEFDLRALGKLDSNGYYLKDNHIFQVQPTTNIKNVERAGLKFEDIVNQYFSESNVYYSIVPDKAYFLPEIPQLSYQEIEQIMVDTFVSAQYIDISGELTLDDYYETDLHWKQEALGNVADYLLTNMGNVVEEIVYEKKIAKEGFLGGYGASSAFFVEKDALYYMFNENLENALVYDYELKKEIGIYDLDKVEGVDPYDIFLGGAKPLLTIEIPNSKVEKELLLFRDSFGSSIAPLWLENYDKITIIDLRYITIEYALTLLGEQQYDDVLFLYNTLLLHNSHSMKL